MDAPVNIDTTYLPHLAVIILILYGAVLAAYLLLFFRENGAAARAAGILAPSTMLLHAAYLAVLSMALKHPPFTEPFESLSTIALLVAIVYYYIELRTRIRSTGPIIFFFVFTMQAFSTVSIWISHPGPHVLGSPLLNLHTGMGLLGYTAFCISFLYSVMYLIMHDDIKRSNFGLMYEKLPSLEQLDDMNYRAAVAGTAVLALSMVVGFAWAQTAFGRFPLGDVKVVVTLVIALIYGSVIVARRRFGWGGERIALLSAFGFVVVLASLLVLNRFSESFHSFF